jgi:hypothetical protein
MIKRHSGFYSETINHLFLLAGEKICGVFSVLSAVAAIPYCREEGFQRGRVGWKASTSDRYPTRHPSDTMHFARHHVA